MSPATVTRFLTEYLRARAEQQPDRKVEPLNQLHCRRDAWELFERFLSSLHFSSKARDVGGRAQYAEAVLELRTTLSARLGALV